ncbi:MAG: 3-dehydroquinate synthase [Candidatus Tectomicrobia bacterium]|nr:3-dehydroquinate synthase [Candidatus Tectomicrobia bacterium]
MPTLTVPLAQRSYPIIIEPGLLARVGAHLRQAGLHHQVAVVTQPPVAASHGARLRAGLEDAGITPLVIEVPDGEASKSLAQASRLYDLLLQARFERGATLLAFGGGVVGDLTGFVAATYLRGIAFVQVPTTLLAQVDSSVGGKTAVNHELGKNLIGAFYQPRAVYIDPQTLRSLPPREYRAGLAEVVKCGFIADAGLVGYLEQEMNAVREQAPEALERMIQASCRIKAEVVGADEEDRTGRRAILNYGHTLAHAIEAVCHYEEYRHGEAVAIGMVCAARLSEEVLGCPGNLGERTLALLSALGLPTRCAGLSPARLLEAMALDKKVQHGRLRFVLLPRVGAAKLVGDVPTELVRRAIPV